MMELKATTETQFDCIVGAEAAFYFVRGGERVVRSKKRDQENALRQLRYGVRESWDMACVKSGCDIAPGTHVLPRALRCAEMPNLVDKLYR